jgi:tetratricopeptide (TPR) repeat protein
MPQFSSSSAGSIRPPVPSASHLFSPLYLGALGGLLLNDHVLKKAFTGLVTGILSDVLGLFAFAVFLSVIWPHRAIALHGTIAVAFVAWKSPASDVVIDAWNAVMPFRVGRVVDYWDLLALSVLPLSLVYLQRARPTLAPRTARMVAVAAVSLFAFTATSRVPYAYNIDAGKEFTRTGEYDRAIQQFDQALRAAPDLPEALYLRGVARLKVGDVAGGEADIARAASIDPKYAPLAPGE